MSWVILYLLALAGLSKVTSFFIALFLVNAYTALRFSREQRSR